MFNKNDLYSASGGVTIFNYWNPFVTKHDTSSFYNWEQDNLPLYDLEERTYYLWEKLGYPLSSIPGMALVVSATIDNSIAASANMFTTVSAAIEALPEIIRMPTLIEVAVAGNMGELNLNNIKCEGDGILEIVNRAGAPLASNADTTTITANNYGNGDQAPWYLPWGLSALQVFGTLSSMSAISLSANTSSVFYNDKTTDVRNIILPGRRGVSIGDTYAPPAYAYPGIADNTVDWRTGSTGVMYANTITLNTGAPAQSLVQDDTIATLDVSCISELDDAHMYGPQYAFGDPVGYQLANGLVAGNWFTSVKAQNCDGPIYVRGFIVDGANTSTTGFKVDNCVNFTLENCGSMRCTTAGFDINNSTVNLRRQAFATRNYNATDRGTIKTYGFKITNSEVDFVTDTYTSGVFAKLASHFHDYGIYLDNSVLRGGDAITEGAMLGSKTFSTEIGVNQTNLYLVNSKYEMNGITSVYQSYNNIEAYDSAVRVEQLHSKYAQNAGLLMFNSSFKYNKNLNINAVGQYTYTGNIKESGNYPILFLNNGQHVVLKAGSSYGPTYPNTTLSATESVTDITTLYNMEMYAEHIGAISENKNATQRLSKPAIVVDNSTAQFTCSKILCSSSLSQRASVYHSPAALHSTNNASVNMVGLANKATLQNTICYATGNASRASLGYLADKGSSIHFTGPNVIYNFGIDAAALDGSRISAGIPLTENGTPDCTLSGWGRGLYPATPVIEAHSGRACFVADNNSELSFEDVGNSQRYWSRINNDINLSANTDYDLSGSYKNTLCASGGLQFYPNSFEVTGNDWKNIITNNMTGFRDAYELSTFAQGGYTQTLKNDTATSAFRILYNDTYSTLGPQMAKISQGGMCVRAAGGSNVKVRNVHFPTGWYNTDGSYYDASSSPAGCDNLMIWNIADTSRLHAAYIAVSGAYPSDAGYTGPRSFYHSGTIGIGFAKDSSSAQYNMPSGTLHTGKLSVLDHFGSGTIVSSNLTYENYSPSTFKASAVWANTSSTYRFMESIQESRSGITTSSTYGEVTAENQGPFRLYFSVSPAAKVLSYVSGWDDPRVNPASNLPYQHLSQGYLLSGDCSGPSDFSGLYPQLLNKRLFELSGILATSGYYYPSELMPKERADVWLDESAANLFSNAKHCNTDYSNRIKLVNIYRARTDNFGEAQSPDASGLGLGFRSSNIFDIDREI